MFCKLRHNVFLCISAKSEEGGCAGYSYSIKPGDCGNALKFTCQLEGPPDRRLDITVTVDAASEGIYFILFVLLLSFYILFISAAQFD